MDCIYRLVDSSGRVIKTRTHPTGVYLSLGTARNARSQLRYDPLTIQAAEVGPFSDVQEID